MIFLLYSVSSSHVAVRFKINDTLELTEIANTTFSRPLPFLAIPPNADVGCSYWKTCKVVDPGRSFGLTGTVWSPWHA
jgi:hypothetical protein